MVENIETERKYDVDASLRTPPSEAWPYATTLSSAELRATYFDTDDLALTEHHMTLRRREGGHDEGWHLKSPAKGGRSEKSAPLARLLPDSLHAQIRDVIGGDLLHPIVTMTTLRTMLTFSNESGAAFAELADDRVTAIEARTAEVRKWREWELELLGAAPQGLVQREMLLDVLEIPLLTAGAITSLYGSKLGRAIGRPPEEPSKER